MKTTTYEELEAFYRLRHKLQPDIDVTEDHGLKEFIAGFRQAEIKSALDAIENPPEIVASTMPIRDIISCVALGGYLAGRNANKDRGFQVDTRRDNTAKSCYGYADAMLKAREVKPELKGDQP